MKQLQEDFQILGGYFRKNLLTYFQKTAYKLEMKFNGKKLKNQRIINILLEFNGAKKLGGEFMGKRYIEKFPVLIYRIKRHSVDSSEAYFYVAYIMRGKEQFQVVIDEFWDSFNNSLMSAVRSNQKAVIGVRKREGGYVHGNSKKRFGRKKL